MNGIFANHRRMGHGFRFLLTPFLYYPPFLKNFHINHISFKISAYRARIWSLVASERSERVTNFIFCRAGWYFSVSIIFTDTVNISRKTVDTEYTYYSWWMTSTDIVKWRKRNDYENFEKEMIYMKIFKKGGVVEKRGGVGNEIHAPCACGLQIMCLSHFLIKSAETSKFLRHKRGRNLCVF
jgi:hypothetical protein